MRSEDSQEDVHCVLFLRIRQSVGVISSHSLHDVIAFTCPWRLLPVGLDPVNKSTTSVLKSQSVSMILVHFLQHPDTIRLNLQPWLRQNPKGMKLESKRTKADSKLSSVGSVKTIHAVGSDNSSLLHHSLRLRSNLVLPTVKKFTMSSLDLLKIPGGSVVEYPHLLDSFVGNVAKFCHHTRIRSLVTSGHVKMVIMDLVLVRKKLIQIFDTFVKFFT